MSIDTWLGHHRQATEAVQPVYRQIHRADLNRMTPCAGWDLHQLLRHMVGQDHGFAAAVRADVGVEAFGPRELGDDIAATLSSTLAAAHQAFADTDPETSILMPEFGMQRFPLVAVIGFHFIDTLVHGWDVAATIGFPLRYEPELEAAALAQARAVPDGSFRDEPGAAFARPLSRTDGSAPWRETLLWLGRDPEWTATGRTSSGSGEGRESSVR
jgi:uncharacterized protein (TIGR03086 family)